ncbi:MAG: hypothetical protein ABI858_07435 [Pseudoxanthomonas sp.]
MKRSATHMAAWLLCALCLMPLQAQCAVGSHRLCPELEPRPGSAPVNTCYVGVPCVIGARGEGLSATNDARVVVLASAAVSRAQVLTTGLGASTVAALCVPSDVRGGEEHVSVRLPLLQQAGDHLLQLQRPILFGISRESDTLPFKVIASHGFLDPRQSAASESARQGESKVFTFTGRNLAALRIRTDAAALKPAQMNAGAAAAAATDVQWMDPEQKQVRVRLTLYRVGQISTREIFEFIGSGESAVNRDLGWPVIQVRP